MKVKKTISLLLALTLLMLSIVSAAITVGAAEKELAITAENVTDNDFNADSRSDIQKLLDLEKGLPTKFDLRDFNGQNYVTPVKLQNPYGSCWAFAMAAAAEISYLYENDMGVPAGEVNDQVDFSEKYISWYMRHALTAEDVQRGVIPASQVGEGFDLSEIEKTNRNESYNLAGNPMFGVNFYASGFGPVDEYAQINGEYPYVYAGKNRWRCSDPDEVSEELARIRKQDNYNSYKEYVDDLIDYGLIKSADEYDAWFESNWKDNKNLYSKSLSDNGYSAYDDWTLPLTAEYRSPTIRAYFKSSYLLPSPCSEDSEGDYMFDRTGLAAIKSELNKGRGVSIGIQADQSQPNDTHDDKGAMNTATWSQYYSGETKMNHLVTIVGYDDNYAKENFTRKVSGQVVSGSTPPENGAFIVKNSWGSLTDEDVKTAKKDQYGNTIYESANASAWGIDNTGYFYLSYYDHSIRTPITFSFYDEDETVFYELNYDQYDLLQDVDYKELIYKNTTKTANVFTAIEDEYLYQISSMVCKPMSTVKYQVYKDVTDTPESGTLIESGEVFKQFSGYQRIDLSEVTFLPKDTKYSVVITQEAKNEDDDNYTPVTVSVCENYNAAKGAKLHSVINPGESFINYGEGWKDFSTMKEDAEKVFFDRETSNYSPSLIQKTYPNGAKDFQVDNFPIKAFLIPASTVTEYMLGDADLDDDVDITDATYIQRHDAGIITLSEKALLAADVDEDDDVSVLDATKIQRWLNEMPAPANIGKSFLENN